MPGQCSHKKSLKMTLCGNMHRIFRQSSEPLSSEDLSPSRGCHTTLYPIVQFFCSPRKAVVPSVCHPPCPQTDLRELHISSPLHGPLVVHGSHVLHPNQLWVLGLTPGVPPVLCLVCLRWSRLSSSGFLWWLSDTVHRVCLPFSDCRGRVLSSLRDSTKPLSLDLRRETHSSSLHRHLCSTLLSWWHSWGPRTLSIAPSCSAV